jgi:hypothetical protein
MSVAKEPFGQAFNPKEGLPPMPKSVIPFYASYIPVKLKGQPDKIAAAHAALAARDPRLLESILNPTAYSPDPNELKRAAKND